MRPIKFRAWRKEEKIMCECHGFDSRNGNIYLSCSDKSHPGCVDSDYLSRYDLMQFTGLLDKNGKEIYEGDILKFTPCGEPAYSSPVTFQYGGFVIGPDQYSDYIKIYPDNVEVLGNIHENPELLK